MFDDRSLRHESRSRYSYIEHAAPRGGLGLAGSELDLPQGVSERRTALDQELCSLLESGLGKLRFIRPLKRSAAQTLTQQALETVYMNRERVTDPTRQTIAWAVQAHCNFEPQLKAYRRMPILLLDAARSKTAFS